MERVPSKVIVIHPDDNVGVALAKPVVSGEHFFIGGEEYVALDDIPVGHKVAIEDIPQGTWVYKFGEQIGLAKTFIEKGRHVHVHNVEDVTDRVAAKYREEQV